MTTTQTQTQLTVANPTVLRPRPGQARRTAVRTVRRIPVWILVGLLMVVVLYPQVWMLLGSFKTQAEFLSDPALSLPKTWQFDNYIAALTNGDVARNYLNSLIVTIPSVLLIVFIGVAAGYALEVMIWKGRNAVLLYVLAGIMVPGQMILLPLFSAYFQAGLTGTLWPLIITYTATGLPLTVFMMATYFRAVPKEIFEAAAIDGASIYRSFRSIGFPMVRNAIFTVALVQFFFIWNDLLIALTFTNSSDLRTIQVGLLNFNGEFGATNYGPLFAAICINVFGTLVLYLILNQRVQKGLTAGSVKG